MTSRTIQHMRGMQKKLTSLLVDISLMRIVFTCAHSSTNTSGKYGDKVNDYVEYTFVLYVCVSQVHIFYSLEPIVTI